MGNRDKWAIGRGITFAIKHNLYFMISVTFSTLLWLWPVLRSYLLILGWYFQILLLFHLTNYFNFCTCVWKKWSNYSWCYINFMSTYIKLPLFYKRYSGTFCNSIKDHLQLRGDLFKVSSRLMLFFLWNNFSMIKDFRYGDTEYIINITTLMIW